MTFLLLILLSLLMAVAALSDHLLANRWTDKKSPKYKFLRWLSPIVIIVILVINIVLVIIESSDKAKLESQLNRQTLVLSELDKKAIKQQSSDSALLSEERARGDATHRKLDTILTLLGAEATKRFPNLATYDAVVQLAETLPKIMQEMDRKLEHQSQFLLNVERYVSPSNEIATRSKQELRRNLTGFPDHYLKIRIVANALNTACTPIAENIRDWCENISALQVSVETLTWLSPPSDQPLWCRANPQDTVALRQFWRAIQSYVTSPCTVIIDTTVMPGSLTIAIWGRPQFSEDGRTRLK